MVKTRNQIINGAYERSKRACEALSEAIKNKEPEKVLETLRRNWGYFHDEYHKTIGSPAYTPGEQPPKWLSM